MERKFTESIKEDFRRLGTKAVLFDFDDTLIFTSEIFNQKIAEFVEMVALETGLDLTKVETHLRKINDEMYKKMGVNPIRWQAVVEVMEAEELEYKGSTIRNLPVLMGIYAQEPRMRPGAVAILEIMKSCGIKMALVTHANEEWTWRKLESSGIKEYFETVVVASEDGHKGVECWQRAMNEMGLQSNECLVVGDSLSGDIIPTAEIGARTMWLHNGSTWSMYKVGTVPDSTVHLDNVNELLSAVARLR